MPRVNAGSGPGLCVPGVYRRLLEREREKCSRLDSRMVCGTAAEKQAVYRRSTALLEALEAGQRVEVPVWMLGGNTVSDGRIRALHRGDRAITAWAVKADDTVAPIRRDHT